jgi:hypothetical protein
MSQESFDALRPTLEAVSNPSPPKMPVHEGLMEAEALHLYLQEHPDLVRRLGSVGLPPDLLSDLAASIEAVRFTQARWLGLQSRRKPQARADAEARARALRAEALAACRWNLRDDPQALAALARITERRAGASFVEGLHALAFFVERHAPAFEQDDTFDALACARELRGLLQQGGLSALPHRLAQGEALLWRDRAWSHLAALLSQLRLAAAYTFAQDPQTLAHFQSAYGRRRNQRRSKP